jgi:hypothetical protein
MGGISVVHWIIVLLFIVLPVWGWCTIVKKAGFSGWWGLLTIVPLVNIAMLFVFAYSKWPTDRPSGGAA